MRWRYRVFLIIILTILSLISGAYFIDRYVIFEDINRFGFWSSYAKEAHFSRMYPSEDEVRSYLVDATILMSSPPNTVVYYFDNKNEYVAWEGSQISFGTWTLSKVIKIMTLDQRKRITIATIFCRWSDDLQSDNCLVVSSLDHMLPFYSNNATRQYKKGNVFHLSSDHSPPMRMPSSALTIESLLKEVESQ